MVLNSKIKLYKALVAPLLIYHNCLHRTVHPIWSLSKCWFYCAWISSASFCHFPNVMESIISHVHFCKTLFSLHGGFRGKVIFMFLNHWHFKLIHWVLSFCGFFLKHYVVLRKPSKRFKKKKKPTFLPPHPCWLNMQNAFRVLYPLLPNPHSRHPSRVVKEDFIVGMIKRKGWVVRWQCHWQKQERFRAGREVWKFMITILYPEISFSLFLCTWTLVPKPPLLPIAENISSYPFCVWIAPPPLSGFSSSFLSEGWS